MMSEDGEGPDQRTFGQMFEMFVTPEVKRRQELGSLPKPFSIVSAQIIFREDGNEVRLNGEVKGTMKVRLKSGEDMVPGRPIFMHEVGAIDAVELPPEERDFGHLTIVRMPENWCMLFDFRQHRGFSLGLIEKANDFLKAAEFSYDNALWGPFYDGLFSASELLAKAQLIHHTLRRDTKSHGSISSALNIWGKLGNAPSEFVSLFNELAGERNRARYSAEAAAAPIHLPDALRIVKAEAARLTESYRSRTDD